MCENIMESLKGLRGGIYFVSEIPRSVGGRVLRRRLKQVSEREHFMTDSSPITNNAILSNNVITRMTSSRRTSSISFTSFQNFSGSNILASSQFPQLQRPTVNGFIKTQNRGSVRNLSAKAVLRTRIKKQSISEPSKK